MAIGEGGGRSVGHTIEGKKGGKPKSSTGTKTKTKKTRVRK